MRTIFVPDLILLDHALFLSSVIGHRRKRRVSKARVEEILGLEVSSCLDDS
jgi:hypothetical protein